MMPHVMFRSDWKTYGCNMLGSENPTDGLPRNMDVTWTTYYGKDFTRIVLELIGALEQRIRVVTIFQGKCNEIHIGYEKETRGTNRCGDE